MEKRKKTRNLSVAEYFIQIQREYLIADFKRKIYFNPKDKAYYSRVIEYKEKRINDIAKRNNLRSILNDENTLERLRKELFDENSYPKFPLNDLDLKNYYIPGNSFSYQGDIWMLERIEHDMAVIKKDGIEKTINKYNIFRIL